MSGGADLFKALPGGTKIVSVSSYKDTSRLHLRRYFGVSSIQYPTKDGISLNRQEFDELVSMQTEIINAFDRLDATTTATKSLPTKAPETIQTTNPFTYATYTPVNCNGGKDKLPLKEVDTNHCSSYTPDVVDPFYREQYIFPPYDPRTIRRQKLNLDVN